jgi:hypothetical protein
MADSTISAAGNPDVAPETPGSHRAIIQLWPSYVAFATDTGQRAGTVRQMASRDSIPAALWPVVVAAAEARGFAGVTLANLAATARPRRRRVAPAAPSEAPSGPMGSAPAVTANA